MELIMADHDHTARARPAVPRGDAFSDSPDADPPASSSPAPSHRSLTPDDVDIAVYCLTVLCIADERWREAQATHTAFAGPTVWPLPRAFREAVIVAIRCLEAFGPQLTPGKP
jgi:hypothetical protein